VIRAPSNYVLLLIVGITIVENNAYSHGGNTGSSPVGSARVHRSP
jgi:hypothetical protein